MKLNFKQILAAVPTLIGLGKSIKDAAKGQPVDSQIALGAEALITLLPVVEGLSGQELADNGRWSEAVSRLKIAVLNGKKAEQDIEAAIVAIRAVVADIKAARR